MHADIAMHWANQRLSVYEPHTPACSIRSAHITDWILKITSLLFSLTQHLSLVNIFGVTTHQNSLVRFGRIWDILAGARGWYSGGVRCDTCLQWLPYHSCYNIGPDCETKNCVFELFVSKTRIVIQLLDLKFVFVMTAFLKVLW